MQNLKKYLKVNEQIFFLINEKIILVTCVLHDKGILKFYRMFKLLYTGYMYMFVNKICSNQRIWCFN